MPFYEYQCNNCGHYLEALQKLSDSPLRKCPSCAKNTLKKLVSAPVFRLKGSGWYETDFKSDQERKRNLAGADAEPGDSSAGTDKQAKGESESGSKAETKPPAAGSGESASAKPAESARASSGAAKPASPASRTVTRTPRPAARTGSARPAKRAPAAPRARASSARARPTRKRR